MKNENTDPAGREQDTTLWLDAPIDLVWKVWTHPDHIKHWWGPDGFTSDIDKMDVRTGGEWNFVMIAPDGTRFPNKTIFRQVLQNRKLVHEHFELNFIATIEFEDHGDRTNIRWYKLYETKELFELVEIHYKSSEGLNQTIKRLKEYLDNTKFKV